MFEMLSVWWSGAVTAAGCLTIFFTFYQLLRSNSSRVYLDFSTSKTEPLDLPPSASAVYRIGGNDFDQLFQTDFLIKNQTGAALSVDEIHGAPSLSFPEGCIILAVSILNRDESSFCKFETDAANNKIRLNELIVPIDGVLHGNIVSTLPIPTTLTFTHKTKRVSRRNYSGEKNDPARLASAVRGMLIMFGPLLLIPYVIPVFKREHSDWLFPFLLIGYVSLATVLVGL